MKNLGYSYYKVYFKNLEFKRESNGEYTPSLKKVETKNFINDLFNSKFNAYQTQVPSVGVAVDKFELTTIYPGLLIGSGYNHEIGKQENELKLGFFFDHTTGLPCIPGSSVKGVLRDACEKVNGEYVLDLVKEIISNKKDFSLNEVYFKKGSKKYSDFVLHTFEGKMNNDTFIPFVNRDLFFDAFPIKSANPNGKFLANDYITPHKHQTNPKLDKFTNPNPIQFLKILPQITFQFNFRLSNTSIPKDVKLELFRQILLDLGVGAKTNVGYGHFKE